MNSTWRAGGESWCSRSTPIRSWPRLQVTATGFSALGKLKSNNICLIFSKTTQLLIQSKESFWRGLWESSWGRQDPRDPWGSRPLVYTVYIISAPWVGQNLWQWWDVTLVIRLLIAVKPKGEDLGGLNLIRWVLKGTEPFGKLKRHTLAGLKASKCPRYELPMGARGNELRTASRGWEWSRPRELTRKWGPQSCIEILPIVWMGHEGYPKPCTTAAGFSALLCPDFWRQKTGNSKWLLALRGGDKI